MNSDGDQGERRAAQWLQEQGLHIIERNFRARCGEIDIVARDGAVLVFVEVRARRASRFASAAASVTRPKQARLLRTAALYLQRHPHLASLACRFDVVAIEPRQSAGAARLRWIRHAFTA
ncbi:MAG: YraN family protein [Halioglobus sp.]|nr:YraN family protein [Halioglobus sp.]|tara:strand:- start:253 stop:612 length:360 start_codon:yes stop_codon:yes gene_type:complete